MSHVSGRKAEEVFLSPSAAARAVQFNLARERTPMSLPENLLRQASLYRDAHRWAEADRWYSAAAQRNQDCVTQVECAIYFAERQQFSAAIRMLIQGLDDATVQGNREMQAVIYSNLAMIYRELGEFELASRFLRQVLALHGDVEASELLDWSQDALLRGNLLLAEKLIQNVRELAEEVVDLNLQADAWGSLGVVAARQAQPRLAVRLLIRAIRGHQLMGDDRGLGTDFQNLAEVFGLLSRLTWQQWTFLAALTCFDRAGMPVSTRRVEQRIREVERLAVYRRMDAAVN